MAGDKQETREAFYILSEVLVRLAISTVEPRREEICIQAIVREEKHHIETHLRGNSAIVMPTCSLMADAASFGGPLCTIAPNHEPCLPVKTSACISRRKQRRRKVYNDNLI